MSGRQGEGKGAKTEELLRAYFLDSGYFVARGVRFTYMGDDVTDIDLWLYMRPSAVTRERVIVDAKGGRTPHAVERIFWTKGLQTVLGLERCIVATTDQRPAVRDFGRRHDVSVLGGQFLSALSKHGTTRQDRLSEEEFMQLLDPDGLGKLRGDWISRMQTSKSRLLTALDFSGCNAWLLDASYYAEECVVDPQAREAACRMLYLTAAWLLVGVDYILKDLSFMDSASRSEALEDGFLHGSKGRKGIMETLEQAIALVENYLPDGAQWSGILRKGVIEGFQGVPAGILREFFSRAEVWRALMGYAIALEGHAFSRVFVPPQDLHNGLRSVLGVILDFSQIERRQFFGAFAQSSPA